jgi:ATP-dependent helicase/nuclease subunit A
MAEQLTPQQYEAVHNRGGKLLVSAAAGSGKTKVLVDRLLSYLMDPSDPANMDDFLIITYTKAAAAELRGKIASKISEAIAANPGNRHLQKQMQRLYLAKISTVHGFCADILKEQAYRLDIPGDFRVADEKECAQLQVKAMEQILEEAYMTAEQNADFRAFIDTQGLGRDDRQIPEIILQVYGSAKCHLDPEGWLSWCENSWDVEGVTDAGQTLWGSYLIRDLKEYLQMHLDALGVCLESAAGVTGMEKPSALLSDTVMQLTALQNAETWDEVLSLSQIDYGRLTFPKNCTDLALAEAIKAVRKACKDGLSKKLRSFADCSAQILADLEKSAAAARGLIALVRAFDSAYEKLKKGYHILDFADLEHKTLDLLLGKSRNTITSAAREIGARFREVMVDEYQDSNGVQDAIFSALTKERNNCFMVGDVKQSIYQFRLADPEIFIEKYNTYLPAAEAKDQQGRKVLLSKNFRSSGGVISGVNDVFRACMSPKVGGLTYGEDEMLYEGIEHCDLGEAEVELHGIEVISDTYAEESEFVAQRITELLDGSHMVRDGNQLRPIKPEDIVILLRSPGSVGGEFRYALEDRGIPCAAGDSADLLGVEEIGAIHALLQIISNPLQEIPLIATLTSPMFCFTADELAQIRSKNRKKNLYHLLLQEQNQKVEAFLQTLTMLRKEARRCNLSGLLEKILLNTNIESYCAAKSDAAVRQENLQSFCQIVSDYEATGHKDLEQFLAFLEAMAERGLTAPGEGKTENAVAIMSIHKSKGLEFPVVFLCGLSREFNRESARKQVLCHKELGLGLNCVDTAQRVRYPTIAKQAIATEIMSQSVSEELRVLYVAMTRARDRLIMTYANRNLGGQLEELALRMDTSSQELLTSEVNCPGDWVLLAALRRPEAGAFFQLCGCNPRLDVTDSVWHIALADTKEEGIYEAEEEEKATLSTEQLQEFRAALSYRYTYEPATQIPSKQTATQLKGRVKDMETAENTRENKPARREFTKPAAGKKRGTHYGNVIHSVMQHIRYDIRSSEAAIGEELHRLVACGLLSQQDAGLVDCSKIAEFFDSELGQKLRTAGQVMREFKFSVLEDASRYYPSVTGEKVLLQGVVDCFIVEDDGLTVMDFKTDYVTEETLSDLVEQYRPQVEAYANALQRIYQKPVKQANLYFFSIGKSVPL